MCVSVRVEFIKIQKKRLRLGPLFLSSLFVWSWGQARCDAVPWDKVEGHTVDAVAQSGGRWAIFEDVTEVSATRLANHLHAPHAVAEVDAFFDT